MQKMMNMRLSPLVLTIVGAVAVAIVAGGCKTPERSGDMATTESYDGEGNGTSYSAGPNRAGALLWSQNCMRCHNLRNPNEKSDREWDVIMLHMRVRANLTAKEHRLILAFLQSAN